MASMMTTAPKNGKVGDLHDRYPWLPESATFSLTPGGWAYSDSGRVYRLDSDGRGPGASVRGLLEAWLPGGRYAVRWADWSLALERAELASLLAQGDAELERLIRRDLFAFRMAVTATKIEAAVPGMELLVKGLDSGGTLMVASLAQKLGAQVYRRRA